MPEITQKLGFEAASAIKTLRDLARATGTADAALRSFNSTVSQGRGKSSFAAFDRLASSVDKSKKSLTGLGKQFKTTGDQGKAATQKITIGFAGLAKALVAREIVSALNNLKTAILDSADAAAEFEITIARISNIADGPGSSIDSLSERISELSVSLGRPVTEVLSAAMEALQNDLGGTAETMDLLAGAADDLALVTGGTLTQSVNTLSSVLKAYNLDVGEASNISDIFFAAIDKGRITLSELENSLGKIVPLSSQVGIGIDEVAAAMAGITQSGTTAAVANTQLRSIFQKLIRPTQSLQAAIESLGADTFKQLAEESGGFQQALTAIAGALGNDSRRIAEAFGRLRGQLGVFNLLANGGKNFTEALDAVANSAGRASVAADLIRNTDAFRSQKEAQEFAETMREIGKTVLVAKTAFVGFANDVLPSGEAIASVITKIAGVTVALGSGAAIASLLVFKTAILASLTPLIVLLPAITAALAGFAIGELLVAEFKGASKQIEDFKNAAKNFIKEIDKNAADELKKNTEAVKNAMESRGELFEKYVKELKVQFDKEAAIFKDASRAASAALSISLDVFEQGIDAVFDRMESRVNSFKSDLASAQNAARSAAQSLADFNFDAKGRNLSNAQNFRRELSRAASTSRRLGESIRASEIDPAEIPKAQALANRFKEQADAARQRAESIKNSGQRERAVSDAIKQQRQALIGLKDIRDIELQNVEKIKDITLEDVKGQQAISDAIADRQRQQADLIKKENSDGTLKTKNQIKNDAARSQALGEEIAKLQAQQIDGFFEKFGEQANVDAISAALQKGFDQAQIDFANVAKGLQEVIDSTEYQAFVKLNVDTTGLSQEIQDAVSGAADGAGANPVASGEAARNELGRQLQLARDERTKLETATKKFEASNTSLITQVTLAFTNATTAQQAAVQDATNQFRGINELLNQSNLTSEQLTNVEQRLDGLSGAIASALKNGNISEETAQALQNGVDDAREKLKQKKIILEVQGNFSDESITAMENQLKGVKTDTGGVESGLDKADLSGKKLAKTLSTIPSPSINTGPILSQLATIEAAARRAAAAVAAAGAGGGGGGANAKTGGRPIFRASGGRGVDTQSAFLEPGEFVTSKRNTNKFFSQLSAMNAGQNPSFREQGGSVTNVGDVNVNVTGGSGSETPDAVGRQIANSLRRELRRKTSAL